MVNGAAQRLPADRGIHAIDLVDRGRAENRVSTRVGTAHVDIGRFAEVAIGAQMFDGGKIVSVISLEQIEGITAENLSSAFQKDLPGPLEDPAHRQAGVVDTIFATYQVLRYQRPVSP